MKRRSKSGPQPGHDNPNLNVIGLWIGFYPNRVNTQFVVERSHSARRGSDCAVLAGGHLDLTVEELSGRDLRDVIRDLTDALSRPLTEIDWRPGGMAQGPPQRSSEPCLEGMEDLL